MRITALVLILQMVLAPVVQAAGVPAIKIIEKSPTTVQLITAGPQGPPGSGGSGGGASGVNWRDSWSSSTAYQVNDAVERNGSSYRAVQSSTGVDPATDTSRTRWFPIALKGATGATGSQGVQGPQGLQGPAGADGAPATNIITSVQGKIGAVTLTASEVGAAPATSGSAILKGNGSGGTTPAVSGTDYLSPSGSAAGLTNFPTLNQNTTGTAAALTTNGSNCAAGQAAAGIDQAGNAEGCFTPPGGNGTADHSALSNLDYASSGHTGFASAAQVAGKVPITASTGVILFSPTGCAAGWQDTMSSEIATYTAAGIQADHIVCYPYTPPSGSASFTFPSVAATGAAGSMTTTYTADGSFTFPAVTATGQAGSLTVAAGASGDAVFTFPSVTATGAAGTFVATGTADASFSFPAVAATGAAGTITTSGTTSNSSPTFTQQPTYVSATTTDITFSYGTSDADGDHYLREISRNSGSTWYDGTVADETPGAGKTVTIAVGGSPGDGWGMTVRMTPLTGNTTPVVSNVVTMWTLPATPTISAVTPADSQNTITWGAATGAASYNLYFTSDGSTPTTVSTKIAGVSSGYIHTGRLNGVTYKYILTAVNSGGAESAASSVVSGTPSAGYPLAISNGASVTTAAYPLTAIVASSGSIQQTAADTFTLDNTTNVTQGAILYNTTAWSGTYTHKIKVTNYGNTASGAMWVPLLSAVPTVSDAVTALTNRKFRFGITQDGSANQDKIYLSYVNTSGTEYFLQSNGTWNTSLVFFTTIGGAQLQIQRDATNYTVSILNADGSAVTGGVGTIAISSVKNGSGSDYLALGDIATDFKSKATFQILP